MYNEEEDRETGGMGPEEHKEETITTNFIMRDPDDGPEQNQCQNQYQSRNQPQAENGSQSGNQLQNEFRPQNQFQTENGSQPGNQTQNEFRPQNQFQTENGSQSGNQTQNEFRPQNQFQTENGSQSGNQPQNEFRPQNQPQAENGSQPGNQTQNDPQLRNQPHTQNQFQPQNGSQNQSQPHGVYEAQQGIPHYQEYRYQKVSQQNPMPAREEPGKKGRFAKRAAGLVGAALVFGIVAGSTMVGINWAAGGYAKEEAVEISQAETLGPVSTAGGNQVSSTAGISSTNDVSAIVDKAMPSVVAITSKVIYESQTWFGPMQREGVGSGSGIIIGKNDDELLIVTNNHVVQGAEELKVTFIDQNAVDASIKGTDSDSDLAVIAVPLSGIPSDTLNQIAIAALGSSDDIKVGQGVVAIGNALGYGQSVTVGYISALDRNVETEDGISRDLLQTDAAINPGNSGGALLNMQGELVGINSAKLSSTEVEGMGYAIPISKVQDILDTLMTKKTRTQVADGEQGYLGIQCKNLDSATSQQLGMPQGVFIYKIVEGGAASRSDLREKDIITKFDGQSIKTYDDLTNMLKYYGGGTTVTLTVQSVENGQYVERNVDVTLDKKPAEDTQTEITRP